MNEANKRLCAIFYKILLLDDIELRDMVISYISKTDYIEATDILLNYVSNEPLLWLRTYILGVIEHLEKLRDGNISYSPTVSEMADTAVGIKNKK